MTQINIQTFLPFEHENSDFIRATITLGRQLLSKGAEGELASAFIFINAIDYLAGHVLQNLKTITYLTTYNELAVVFKKDTDFEEIPLGPTIKELRKYDFPDKADFLSDLDHFNKIRTKVTHNLLRRYKLSEATQIDTDLQELIKTAERLIARYDTIALGIRNMWQKYCQDFNKRRGYVPVDSNSIPVYPQPPSRDELGSVGG